MIDKRSLLLISTWLLLVLFSFIWNYNASKKEQARIALLTSRGVFEHILTTRLWNARHGSLYAPVTSLMPPNKYLKVPMRDIKVNNNFTLTQINPSFMTRQISEIAMEQNGIQFHMTSLDPIRKKNKPTLREENILKKFGKGEIERGFFFKEDKKEYYFYMAQLKAEKECLKCHIKQGYKEGDTMGGISLKLPMVAKLPINSLILGHTTLGIFGLFGIIFGIKRLNSAYDKIRYQALTDALTGIPNRRNFSETILKEYTRSRRECKPLSLVMCDIDNFKKYNDTYGHSQGDTCLKNVAQILFRSLNRAGDFCARYGGEEFVVILPNTLSEGAIKIAEKIRANIEDSQMEHINSLPEKIVTISLGVATLEATSAISHEELIKKADTALYKAKEQGRNRVLFQ